MTFKQVFPNPYDQSTPNLQPETIPLEEIIRQGMVAHTMKLRVCLPASITKVIGNQQVSVQPLLQSRYTDQTVVNLPVIQNVAVSMPMGQNYAIRLPIAVGDTGFLIFSDRSLDAWLHSGGGIIDPQDSRQHFLQDAIFVPGLTTFPNQTTDGTTDLIIKNGTAVFRELASGKFKIANDSTTLNTLLQNLISNIKDLVTAVGDITVGAGELSSPAGPVTGISGGPLNSSEISNVTTELTTTANQIAELLE